MVGVNAPNSIAAYEVTKILESGGLDWNDIETKVIPFPQMAVAFTTKAIDAGLLITPYTAQLPEQNLAEHWIDVDDSRQAAAAEHFGVDVQHRLGEQESRRRCRISTPR